MSYSPLPNSFFPPRNPSGNTGDSTHRSMSHHPKEPIELELSELPRTQSEHSYSSRSHLPDKKFEPVALDQPRSSPRTVRHGKTRGIIRKLWLTAFLPAVAFAYLSFCYVTATSLVPVRIWMIDQPAEHLYGIKAGVTTINIIVVAIALLPLKTLLDDIKASEEFFRTLHKSPSGVPLGDINSVSIPSNTFARSIRSIFQNRASKYYAGAILSGITAALISSLAPAALSVGLVSADSDIMALEVGAISKDSVYRFGANLVDIMINDVFQDSAGEAASMGWVRNVLGAEIAFTPTSAKYGVPVPLSLDPTARARYLTDVVVMDPVCNWTVPGPPVDSGEAVYSQLVMDLPDFGFQIKRSNTSFHYALQKLKSLDVAGDGTSLDLVNLMNSTSSDPITDGTMAWIVSRCTSCTTPVYSSDKSVFDLSGVPTREYRSNETATPFTAEYSVLVCNPRVSIETREVVLDGTGQVEVLESAGLTSQGNLHLLQTKLLLGNGLMKYTSDSGPETTFTEIGRAAQVKMFFGSNLGNSTKTPVLRPQPIEKITEQYELAQQAALRSYLSGALATAYVPGRVQVTKLVFTSSLPHIIVSTILFVTVALFINICYLRADMEQFTLFSIATALARSNVGTVCEDAKFADRAQRGSAPDGTAVGLIEDRRVYLSNNGGPGPSLHVQ